MTATRLHFEGIWFCIELINPSGIQFARVGLVLSVWRSSFPLSPIGRCESAISGPASFYQSKSLSSCENEENTMLKRFSLGLAMFASRSQNPYWARLLPDFHTYVNREEITGRL